MQKTLTLAFLLAAYAQANAQFITLRDMGNNVVNSTVMIHNGSADEGYMEADVSATLNMDPARNINVKRYELDVQPLTQNYFCWGVCYGPQDAGALPFWQALPQHSLSMSAGTALNNFHAYHVPAGVVGTSIYRYVWFDTAQPNDSVWVDIEFHSTPVGIAEQAVSASMSVFPSPSQGNDVEFVVDMAGSTANSALVVYNMVGERVRTTSIRAAQTRTTLSAAGLSSGIYFATVERNGTVLGSRRFVVTR